MTHEVYVPDEFASSFGIIFGGNSRDADLSLTKLFITVTGSGGEVFVMEADESKAPFAVERIPVDNGVVTVDIPVDMVLDSNGDPLPAPLRVSCTMTCAVLATSVSDGKSYGYRPLTLNETGTDFVIPSSPSVSVPNGSGG